MITRPEFVEASAQLRALATRIEDEITAKLAGTKSLADSIKITRDLARVYHLDYEDLLATTLARTGTATAAHYNEALSTNIEPERLLGLVQEQIVKQSNEKYYGATLDQRLQHSRFVNEQRIQKSAQVGASLDTRQQNLSRILLNPYPFGAQINVDQRLMLGQLIKLEHDIALAIAKEANVKIVKWTLSHKHKKRDICDEYAARVSKDVVKWLKENNIRISAEGLYMVKNAPEPPHPNCQCHLQMLDGKKLRGGIIARTVRRIRELLGNLGQRP